MTYPAPVQQGTWAAAYYGAYNGMDSQNRILQPANVLDPDEVFSSRTNQASIGYSVAAASFALSVDGLFDTLGIGVLSEDQLAALQGICRGIFVNRAPSVLVPDFGEEIDPDVAAVAWMQTLDPGDAGPFSDPATYDVLANAVLNAMTFAEQFPVEQPDLSPDIPAIASSGQVIQVRSQQLTAPTDVTSAAFVPVNQAPSTPTGSFPDIVMNVTPGNKVIVQFIGQVSTDGQVLDPGYRIDAEDGAGNGFNPVATSFVIPAVNGRPSLFIQAEYIAVETQQTLRMLWQADAAFRISANAPSAIGPFSLQAEEIQV